MPLDLMTVWDLKISAEMPGREALKVAKELWGERALAYHSTTNNFFFIALLPAMYDVDPNFEGIMPSDILGYGKDWIETFGMALRTIPILVKKDWGNDWPWPPNSNLGKPWAGNIPMGYPYNPFSSYATRAAIQQIYPPPAPLITQLPPKPKPKTKSKAKNWKTDQQTKIPKPGPKPKLKPKGK